MQIGTLCAEKLSQENIRTALSFCDVYLGKGLYSAEMLEEISRKEHHYFYLLSENGENVGIFYCYAAPRSEIEAVTHTHIPVKDSLIGLNRSIALSPSVRGQMLSDQLLNTFSQMLHDKEGVNFIYTLAWIRDKFIPAEGHLHRCGYSYVLRVPHPWRETKGLLCPACKKENCICDGALYEKRF